MLKLQLITVIDFKYKIKIKFFFTEGLFLSTSYIYIISIIKKTQYNTFKSLDKWDNNLKKTFLFLYNQ